MDDLRKEAECHFRDGFLGIVAGFKRGGRAMAKQITLEEEDIIALRHALLKA